MSDIIKKDGIQKIQYKMKELRELNLNLNKDIDDMVEKNIREEKLMVEKAIKNYNIKMEKVLKDSKVKEKLDKKYNCEVKIRNLMNNIQTSLREAIKVINSDLTIDDKEKKKKIESLQQRIEDAILSDEEKNIKALLEKFIGDNINFKMVKI